MKTRRSWWQRLITGVKSVAFLVTQRNSARETIGGERRKKLPGPRRAFHALLYPFGWPVVGAGKVSWVLVRSSQMRWILQDVRGRRAGLGLTAEERHRVMFDEAVAIAKAEFPFHGIVKETLQFPELLIDRPAMDLPVSGYSCHLAIALATWSAMGWVLKTRFLDTQILATGSFFGAKVGVPEKVSDEELLVKLQAFEKGDGLHKRRIMLFPVGNLTARIAADFQVRQVSDLATWDGREPQVFWVEDIRVLHAVLFEAKPASLAEQTSAAPQWEITQATRLLLEAGKGAAPALAAVPQLPDTASGWEPAPLPQIAEKSPPTATVRGSWSEQDRNRSSQGTLTGSGDLAEILRLFPNAKLQVSVASNDGRRYASSPNSYSAVSPGPHSKEFVGLIVLASVLFVAVLTLIAILATRTDKQEPVAVANSLPPPSSAPTAAAIGPTPLSGTEATSGAIAQVVVPQVRPGSTPKMPPVVADDDVRALAEWIQRNAIYSARGSGRPPEASSKDSTPMAAAPVAAPAPPVFVDCGPSSPEHGAECRDSGRCTSRDGRCVATEGDCLRSTYCKTQGLCELEGDSCIRRFSSDDDCAKSRGKYRINPCKDDGLCTFVDGKCKAVSSSDCRKSTKCRELGECDAKDGACTRIIFSDEDCHKSPARFVPSPCRSFGACVAKNGECVATSDSNCARSISCIETGECALSGDRCAFVPTSTADCRRKQGRFGSSSCRFSGDCTFLDGKCIATSETDCRRSIDCKESGYCRLVGQSCAP